MRCLILSLVVHLVFIFVAFLFQRIFKLEEIEQVSARTPQGRSSVREVSPNANLFPVL